MKKTFFIISTLFITLVIIETISAAAFFLFFTSRLAGFHCKSLLITESERKYIESFYNREVGWLPRHINAEGAKPDPARFDGPMEISFFGDSFVNGAEVEDDQTLPHHLAQILQKNVLNFGVGGYGTDQSYLRFLQVADSLKTPTVILGFTLENISRSVNVYRRFYTCETGIPMTKPHFQLEKGNLKLIPNPIADASSLKNLKDSRFIHQLGTQDFWYQRSSNRSHRFHFPYTFAFFNSDFWLSLKDRRRSEAEPHSHIELWGDESIRATYFKILEAFIKDCEHRSYRPMLFVFPKYDEMQRLVQKRDVPPLRPVASFCRKTKAICFNGLDALARAARRQGLSPDDSRLWQPGLHLSSLGNQLLAQEFATFLKPDSE